MPDPSPQRPVTSDTNPPPGTFDTMPASGISSFYKYKNKHSPNELYTFKDFYFLGTHQNAAANPVRLRGTFLEKASHTAGNVTLVAPLGADFTSTWWTFVHVVWIPIPMTDLGVPDTSDSPTHVLTTQIRDYLLALRGPSLAASAHVLPVDPATGDHVNSADSFRDGLVHNPTGLHAFSGYQVVTEKLVFRSSLTVGADGYSLGQPALAVSASSQVVAGWLETKRLFVGQTAAQIYGRIAAKQAALDAATPPRPRLRYTSKVSVVQNGGTPGAELATPFKDIWPADATFIPASEGNAPALKPAFHQSVNQTTPFFPNHPQGFILNVTLTQQ